MAPKIPFPRTPRRFLAIFGSPPGPQNCLKIDPWPQKGRQETICYRFFIAESAFLTFGIDLSSIFGGKNIEKIGAFFKAARVFFNMAMA